MWHVIIYFFNMIIIIIITYIKNVQYLTYTDIGKRMIDNIAICKQHLFFGWSRDLTLLLCSHMSTHEYVRKCVQV